MRQLPLDRWVGLRAQRNNSVSALTDKSTADAGRAAGLESPSMAAAGVTVANEAGVCRGRPTYGLVGVSAARPYERRSHRPCHYRAIHSSPDWSQADSHGQCRDDPDLRPCPDPQLAIPLELALQASVSM